MENLEQDSSVAADGTQQKLVEFFEDCTGRSPTDSPHDKIIMVLICAYLSGEKPLSKGEIANRIGLQVDDFGRINVRHANPLGSDVHEWVNATGKYHIQITRARTFFLLKNSRSKK